MKSSRHGAGRTANKSALAAAALGSLMLAAPGHAQTRTPWHPPFDSSAIWNTPIGKGADYTGPLDIGDGSDFSAVDVAYPIRLQTID